MLFDSYDKIIFFDGAIGTMLQGVMQKPGVSPATLSITNPKAVENVHRMYVEAGSDIICTNTFGANANTLRLTGYSPEEIILASVDAAKRGAADKAKIALDVGPMGILVEPSGTLTRSQAYDLFAEQAVAVNKVGVDFIAIETMSDLNELEPAILAFKENTAIPIFATMTFHKNGFTFMGCSPEEFVKSAESLGVAAVGLNCSLGPSDMYMTAEKIIKSTSLPVIIKPNAGLPDVKTGLYNLRPAQFAKQMLPFKEMGARIIGGCCGTTPEFITELIKVFNT
jgi:5-methyltetrahydrofolate--homocysteine methyltransferase